MTWQFTYMFTHHAHFEVLFHREWKIERYCFTLQRRTSVILWILPTPLWERMTLLHRRSDIYGMPSQDTHHFSMSLMRNHSILISLWKNVRESGQQWIKTKIYLTIWWAAISRHILVHVHLHVQCICFLCILVNLSESSKKFLRTFF